MDELIERFKVALGKVAVGDQNQVKLAGFAAWVLREVGLNRETIAAFTQELGPDNLEELIAQLGE